MSEGKILISPPVEITVISDWRKGFERQRGRSSRVNDMIWENGIEYMFDCFDSSSKDGKVEYLTLEKMHNGRYSLLGPLLELFHDKILEKRHEMKGQIFVKDGEDVKFLSFVNGTYFWFELKKSNISNLEDWNRDKWFNAK